MMAAASVSASTPTVDASVVRTASDDHHQPEKRRRPAAGKLTVSNSTLPDAYETRHDCNHRGAGGTNAHACAARRHKDGAHPVLRGCSAGQAFPVAS